MCRCALVRCSALHTQIISTHVSRAGVESLSLDLAQRILYSGSFDRSIKQWQMHLDHGLAPRLAFRLVSPFRKQKQDLFRSIWLFIRFFVFCFLSSRLGNMLAVVAVSPALGIEKG